MKRTISRFTTFLLSGLACLLLVSCSADSDVVEDDKSIFPPATGNSEPDSSDAQDKDHSGLFSTILKYKGAFQSSVEQTDQRTEETISAIRRRDVQYIERLFSQKALEETETFYEDVERLFAFFDGEVLSYEFKSELVSDDKSDGLVMTKCRCSYLVSTDEEDYLFFYYEFPRDQADPSNEGVYMFQVITMKNRELLFDGGQTILYPGVYVPEG